MTTAMEPVRTELAQSIPEPPESQANTPRTSQEPPQYIVSSCQSRPVVKDSALSLDAKSHKPDKAVVGGDTKQLPWSPQASMSLKVPENQILGRPIADKTAILTEIEHVPVADELIPQDAPSNIRNALGVPSLSSSPLLPGLPGVPTIPGMLMDQTGLAAVPPTPISNLNKKQKSKIKAQKLIRLCRRIVLRKSVLSIVLGRQLGGTTCDAIKLISKGLPLDVNDITGISTGAAEGAISVPAHAPVPL